VAMNDPMFYQNLPFVDWEKEATHYNIMPQVQIERAAANDCHMCTTVSDVTAQECIYLLGRTPDAILPNGLNIERFEALHQVQNLHQEHKEKIHRFSMAYFFPSYSFDLDNTLYFFTSGRFEYKNKGFDMTLKALSMLNERLKADNSPLNIVMFFITRQPYHSINPEVLHSRALMEELRQTCSAIEKQVGRKLFYTAAGSTSHRLPELNDFVEDYWKLRYRRTLQSWKNDKLPPIVTHNLMDDQKDEILEAIRKYKLLNFKEDNIKVVYHPDFVSASSPLWGIDYGQFVRGCHLGIFPSYYEPWGYTPLECIARGVPAVTSDLSGFGDYVIRNIKDHDESGLFVVRRHHRDYAKATEDLADALYRFTQLSRRERITLRNKVEGNAIKFDWKVLAKMYESVYKDVTEG
ncbi:MAG: glycosyltransferase, partial [Cyclobacteriaceae bacterium]